MAINEAQAAMIDQIVEEARGMLARGENVVADWTGTDADLLVEIRRRLESGLKSDAGARPEGGDDGP